MNIEELETKAETFRGQNVIVDMNAGDRFPGTLTSVKTNTVTFQKAIELTDQNGKALLIPLDTILNIETADQN